MHFLDKQRSLGDKIFDALLTVVFVLFSLTVLYPFVYLLALSFNEGSDALRGGITVWPRVFTLENYAIIFQNEQLLHAVFISVSRTALGGGLDVFLSGICAYFFTKRYIVGYKFYVTLLVLPMYFSAGMIPTYLVYRGLGLTDSFLVYIVPNLVWAYNILIMRTFFYGLPQSLEESAHIDGANEYTIFFRIIIPLSTPVLATIFLFDAVWQWNSWFDTLIYAGSNDKLNTLMSLLAKMIMQLKANEITALKTAHGAKAITSDTLRAAMTIVTTLPIVMVYPFLQKYFVKGILVGAVKG
jgi:putative aldouronate transport system permease protein